MKHMMPDLAKIAATVALQVLEAIRATNPELIADNMPGDWGMKKLREALTDQPLSSDISTQQVQLATKMTGVPEDFLSHHASWRAALELCIETAPEATHDMDDKAYWRHELSAFDRAYAELNARGVVVENFLQSQVAGMNGLTIERALAADWGTVHGSLVQARDHLQKDGVRHTWLDGAIAVAESRTKVPVPDSYLGRESIPGDSKLRCLPVTGVARGNVVQRHCDGQDAASTMKSLSALYVALRDCHRGQLPPQIQVAYEKAGRVLKVAVEAGVLDMREINRDWTPKAAPSSGM